MKLTSHSKFARIYQFNRFEEALKFCKKFGGYWSRIWTGEQFVYKVIQ